MQIVRKTEFVLRDENPKLSLARQKERGHDESCPFVEMSCDPRREADAFSRLYGAEVLNVAVGA